LWAFIALTIGIDLPPAHHNGINGLDMARQSHLTHSLVCGRTQAKTESYLSGFQTKVDKRFIWSIKREKGAAFDVSMNTILGLTT